METVVTNEESELLSTYRLLSDARKVAARDCITLLASWPERKPEPVLLSPSTLVT